MFNIVVLSHKFPIILKCADDFLRLKQQFFLLFGNVLSKNVSLILKLNCLRLRIECHKLFFVLVNNFDVLLFKGSIGPGLFDVNFYHLINKRFKLLLVKGFTVSRHVEGILFDVDRLSWFENELNQIFDIAFDENIIMNRALLPKYWFVLHHFEKIVQHCYSISRKEVGPLHSVRSCGEGVEFQILCQDRLKVRKVSNFQKLNDNRLGEEIEFSIEFTEQANKIF